MCRPCLKTVKTQNKFIEFLTAAIWVGCKILVQFSFQFYLDQFTGKIYASQLKLLDKFYTIKE